jgi:3-hydroxybutyryl-CoA dehydrogenase
MAFRFGRQRANVTQNSRDIRTISVVGAGLMGHGITLEFALAGYDVWLHSHSEESLERARGMIRDSLERLHSFGRVSEEQIALVPSAVQMSTDLEVAVVDADLVIESIYEDLQAKRDLFRGFDELCPDHTIIASNTSSFPPSKLAEVTDRPEKVINTHFLNPPFLVPLVEVVPTPQTSEETTMAIMNLLTAIGKKPILVEREVPGFVASRLQAALLREALWLVENDVASAEDVDIAISQGLGRRWASTGVLQVLEIAGWDLISRIASDVFPHLSNSDDALLLKEMVRRGDSGVKSGKGFYEWTPDSVEALKRRIAKGLVEIDGWDDI